MVRKKDDKGTFLRIRPDDHDALMKIAREKYGISLTAYMRDYACPFLIKRENKVKSLMDRRIG